jgi:hypothetical protein
VKEKRRPCGNLMCKLEENALFSDIDSEARDFLLNIPILMVKLHKVRTRYERRLSTEFHPNVGVARDEGEE